MKRLKIFLYTLLFSLLAHPCTHTQPNQADQTRWSTKKKVVVAGLCVGGIAVTAATIYYLAKHRPVTSQPTPSEFTTLGNKDGQPIVYSHGLGRYFGDVYCYLKDQNCYYIFDPDTHHIATFNYPDSTVGENTKERIKKDQVSLGQENDINRLNEAINQFDKQNCLAFGVSRGASTLINFMGTKGHKNIQAMILEAPFSSMKDALKHIYMPKNFLRSVPLLEKAVCKTAHIVTSALFPQYKLSGVQPIKVIDKINPSIPILLIHSVQDAICPLSGSRKLYIKRRNQGCDNVYLLELQTSNHGRGLRESEGELFQNVVHAFYKKHNFPYNEDFANKITINEYQPSIEEVEKRIKQSR